MTAPAFTDVPAKLPKKLSFFPKEKWRYKGARGGRGSAKSRTIATSLVLKGSQRSIRWLCARETQLSLKFSSKQILVDAIERLGLQSYYRVLDDEIRGVFPDKRGRVTVFIFKGIREMSVDDIKSLEDFDGIWIAEAHALSEASWNKITPTFRKEGWHCWGCDHWYDGKQKPTQCTGAGCKKADFEYFSAEIWFDYNPELEEDFIHRWSNDPPPNAKVVHVNYEDNHWFPDVLRADMEHMKATDYEAYEHVWLGKARNSVVGAVYGKEMAAAYETGRIVLEPGIGVDRMKPVDCFLDIGHGDATAIWFAQAAAGWFNVLEFYQNDHESIEHYVSVINSRGYMIGLVWLPWDGVDAQLHHNLTGSNIRSPEQVMRSLGVKVRVAAKTSNSDVGISAVRTVFPQLRFNEPKCFEGIRHLRMYQWGKREPNKDGITIVQTKPVHDEHSHAADALKTLAVCIKQPRYDGPVAKSQPQRPTGPEAWMA